MEDIFKNYIKKLKAERDKDNINITIPKIDVKKI